jgi:hypothetical protein
MNDMKPEALNETERTALRAASEAFVLIRMLSTNVPRSGLVWK